MTEDEAREQVRNRVGPAAFPKLNELVALVLAENDRQNLVAPTSTDAMWSRHLLDSVQLLQFAPAVWAQWLDIGTGGGFPGLAVAAATSRSVTLVEPRRRRADFLRSAAATLDLPRVTVVQSRVEQSQVAADVISARAVASMEKLLLAASHCATAATTWILPRGRSGADELDQVRRSWNGMFHVERSLTDAASLIVVASGVSRR